MTEDWDFFVAQIFPDEYQENLLLSEITDGKHEGRELDLVHRAIAERLPRLLHGVLNVDGLFVPKNYTYHKRVLDPLWITLTCPYDAEHMTTELLDHNFSYAGVTYEVTINDSYRRLIALHNAGVNIRDPNDICSSSMFFLFLLILARVFPASGLVKLREVFPLPRTL